MNCFQKKFVAFSAGFMTFGVCIFLERRILRKMVSPAAPAVIFSP